MLNKLYLCIVKYQNIDIYHNDDYLIANETNQVHNL